MSMNRKGKESRCDGGIMMVMFGREGRAAAKFRGKGRSVGQCNAAWPVNAAMQPILMQEYWTLII